MTKEISPTDQNFTTFVKDIKSKILSSQYEALKAVNKALINLYWDIGKNIVQKQEQLELGLIKKIREFLAQMGTN